MDESRPERRSALPALLVSLPVALNLWLLRGELRAVEFVNDESVHATMIRWAGRAFRSGHVPLDDWFPYLTTGFPQFRQYQSLPHILMGPIAAVIGGDRALRWSMYLLVALWPVAVYLGARLLGWERSMAAGAALICPLLVSRTNYGYEFGSYVWAGLGLWAQAWGMFMMPLVLGLTWRALEHGRAYWLAALALASTLAFHVITGFFAFLALGVWLYVGPFSWLRLKRTVLLGLASAAVVSWFVIPAAAGRGWSATRRPFSLPPGWDSYGVRRVLGWLVTGRLFDRGRFPTITILVFVGLAVCLARFRNDARARALVVAFALGLLLLFGPAATGNILNLVPGSGAILFQRFVIAVHMPGILLAAVGGVFLVRAGLNGAQVVRPQMDRGTAALAIAALVAAWLLPAWRERAQYTTRTRAFITDQQRAENRDGGRRMKLIAMARDRGGGRIYAGRRANWGHKYKVGFVPGYGSVLNADAEGIGFVFRTGSIVRGVEAAFNGADPYFYDLFNVRYLLLPRSLKPSVPADLLARSGRHTLWSVRTSGYFMFVDTIEPIRSDPRRFTKQMIRFNRSDAAHARLFPTVAFAGRPAARPTSTRLHPPPGRPGSLSRERALPAHGVFRTTVRSRRTAALVLKASYQPRWTARVDGKSVHPYLVAPGFPAVTVRPGIHTVVFEYRPYRLYPLLFALVVFVLAGLFWLDRHPNALPTLSDGQSRAELPPGKESKNDFGRQNAEGALGP